MVWSSAGCAEIKIPFILSWSIHVVVPLCLFPALVATGSLQSTFNPLRSRSVAGFKALPTCPVPASEVFRKVHELNLLPQPHLHVFCTLPGVFEAPSSLAGLIGAGCVGF